jgi:hypothetical protein
VDDGETIKLRGPSRSETSSRDRGDRSNRGDRERNRN